jgi:hypothetical protein
MPKQEEYIRNSGHTQSRKERFGILVTQKSQRKTQHMRTADPPPPLAPAKVPPGDIEAIRVGSVWIICTTRMPRVMAVFNCDGRLLLVQIFVMTISKIKIKLLPMRRAPAPPCPTRTVRISPGETVTSAALKPPAPPKPMPLLSEPPPAPQALMLRVVMPGATVKFRSAPVELNICIDIVPAQ